MRSPHDPAARPPAAPAFAGAPATGADHPGARLGWWYFLLQFVSVAVVYLVFAVAAVLAVGQNAAGLLASVMFSMIGGLLVAGAWLVRDGALGTAWNLRPASGSWRRTIGLGAAGTGAIAACFLLGGAALRTLGLPDPDVTLIMGMVTRSWATYAIWVVLVAWLTAGLGEELLWRGFLLDRLMRVPGVAGRLWLGIVLQAIVFGLAHGYQGGSGLILTTVIGVFFGWLRIAARWSLLPLVIAHAGVDTVMMTLGLAEARGWIAG